MCGVSVAQWLDGRIGNPKAYGFDPHPGQLIVLSLVLTAIAGVCDSLSLSHSYSSPFISFLSELRDRIFTPFFARIGVCD